MYLGSFVINVSAVEFLPRRSTRTGSSRESRDLFSLADLRDRRERSGLRLCSPQPVDASPRVRTIRDTAPCIYVYMLIARECVLVCVGIFCTRYKRTRADAYIGTSLSFFFEQRLCFLLQVASEHEKD